MADIPVLSSTEIQNIRQVLENRLTDTCYLFTSIGQVYKTYAVNKYIDWQGTSTPYSTSSALNLNFYTITYGAASWGSAVSCRVHSLGTGSKLESNSTVFTTNISLEVATSVSIQPVTQKREYPSPSVYDGFYLLGTWVAYGGRVWRVLGINVTDSVPTIQTATLELDYADDSAIYTVSGSINGYATVGDALEAYIGSIPA